MAVQPTDKPDGERGRKEGQREGGTDKLPPEREAQEAAEVQAKLTKASPACLGGREGEEEQRCSVPPKWVGIGMCKTMLSVFFLASCW